MFLSRKKVTSKSDVVPLSKITIEFAATTLGVSSIHIDERTKTSQQHPKRYPRQTSDLPTAVYGCIPTQISCFLCRSPSYRQHSNNLLCPISSFRGGSIWNVESEMRNVFDFIQKPIKPAGLPNWSRFNLVFMGINFFANCTKTAFQARELEHVPCLVNTMLS